jgi:hypothetical protein
MGETLLRSGTMESGGEAGKSLGRSGIRPCYEDCQVSFGFICFFSLRDVFVFVFRLRFLFLRIRMIPDQPAIRTCPLRVSA